MMPGTGGSASSGRTPGLTSTRSGATEPSVSDANRSSHIAPDDARTGSGVGEQGERSEGSEGAAAHTSHSSLLPRVPADLVLPSDRMFGLAGDFVRVIEPHTEADPSALYVSILAALGNMIGPGPHVLVGATQHPAKLFVLVVGETAKARKGTSWAEVMRFSGLVDPTWARTCIASGLGSGEALIALVADPEDAEDGTFQQLQDPRKLVSDGEYARTLSVCKREGSTLSASIRDAWDDQPMRSTTKGRTLTAEEHHISIVSHSTRDELQAKGLGLDVANGFLNRFVIARSQRSKLLPNGGTLDEAELRPLVERAQAVVESARQLRRVRRSAAAEARWVEVYHDLALDDPGGLLGACIARAEPIVLRFSLCFALLDQADQIDVRHIDAAADLWRYCRESARWVIGDSTGVELADRVEQLLRERGDMSRTAIVKALSGHVREPELTAAIGLLLDKARIVEDIEPTRGRPRAVYRLAGGQAEAPASSTERVDE